MAVDTCKMTELKNESDLNGFLSWEKEKLHVVVCLTDWSRVCRNLKRNLGHLLLIIIVIPKIIYFRNPWLKCCISQSHSRFIGV